MKKEFKIVCRVLATEKQDILTASATPSPTPSQSGNLYPSGSANGLGAPQRAAEGPKFE